MPRGQYGHDCPSTYTSPAAHATSLRQGSTISEDRSGIAAMSGDSGPWPMYPAAKPAKPAPSRATSTRCAIGTSLALGTPASSTNELSRNLTPCSSNRRRTSAGSGCACGGTSTTVTMALLNSYRHQPATNSRRPHTADSCLLATSYTLTVLCWCWSRAGIHAPYVNKGPLDAHQRAVLHPGARPSSCLGGRGMAFWLGDVRGKSIFRKAATPV